MEGVMKLILLFYSLSKKYAREIVAGGDHRYVYSDDGNGNVTIAIEEV